MNRLQNIDKAGGFPLKSDDLRYIFGYGSIDAGMIQALNSLLRSFGDDFIVYGCTPSGSPGNISAGWIMLGGELLKVDAHASTDDYYVKVTTNEDSRTFKDGSGPYNVHQKNRATCSVGSGTLKYNGDTLKSLINAETLSNVITNATGTLKCKVVEIGDWDMDSNAQPVAQPIHYITYANIRSVEVTIRGDSDYFVAKPLTYYKHDAVFGNVKSGGHFEIYQTTIDLTRISGGEFDTANYNETSYNRGWVTIWYVA